MDKSLSRKLAALRADARSKEFILADARDADMAWGIGCAGTPWPTQSPERFLSMPEFIEQIREIVKQALVDIVLGSVSTISLLAHKEQLFADSAVTPAVRANDTTDIWLPRGGRYHLEASRPFATCDLEEAQFGRVGGNAERNPVVNLGLYSMTFNNDLERDRETLGAFKLFRRDAAQRGFRYFLEVFAPNVPVAIPEQEVPAFVNDNIVRALAGVSRERRPEFLKIPYFGRRWLEELVQHDPTLIVGILGGSSGTTRDAFELVEKTKRFGARAALFGRKIKDAEHPLLFVQFLRKVADEQISAVEAVRAYHAELDRLKIPTKREHAADLEITTPVLKED
jgi:hypothetical protein